MRVHGGSPAVVLAATVAAAGVLGSGCSLLGDAATSATAPLSALPATDFAVETNVESSLTIVRTAEASGGALSPTVEPGFVTGASDNPDETSYAAPSDAVTVLAVYNDVTRDCLGVAVLSSTPSVPVLGRSAPGTYYFVAHSTPPGACLAATYAAEEAVPSGWPAGDPSSSGFPAA